MRFAMLACVVTACAPMAPSGNPLKPVVVEVAAKAIADASASDEEPDAATNEVMEDEAPFTISSEELHAPTDSSAAATEASPAATGEPEPVAAAETTAAPAATPRPPMKGGWTDGMTGTQWPVRLVTTVPSASPPRAILGLPDGREIVVNPGSMVPELGLVVVAIAPGTAELARIAPAGDHATIESMTLQAQY